MRSAVHCHSHRIACNAAHGPFILRLHRHDSRHRALSSVSLSPSPPPNLIDVLSSRGFLSATTHPLPVLSSHFSTPRTLYAGFDPTAPSLHLGNLLVLQVLSHAQRCGHRVICVLGGATGMIGDPSGRNTERAAMTQQQLQLNTAGIQRSMEQVLTFADASSPPPSFPPTVSASSPPPALLLNNLQWLSSLSLLSFLSSVGVHCRVASLMSKTSVASRLSSGGLSFAELSYQLLQGFDFAHLHRHYGCTAQVGGSDQWGNITSGMDIIRRQAEAEVQVFGLTLPLLTTAAGEKFGKSAGNAVWLDAQLTSPYQLYQHLLHTLDADVPRFLRLFTSLPLQEIDHACSSLPITAQLRLLASEATRLIHGERGLQQAQATTDALFHSSAAGQAEAEGAKKSRQDVVGVALLSLLCSVGAVGSKAAGRRLVQGGGLYLNGQRVQDSAYVVQDDDVKGGVLLLRVGKQDQHVVRVQDSSNSG